MNENLTPFSKNTTIEMWTDPYISKQMLKYHLSFDNDIASRKKDTIQKTCEFISKHLDIPSKICDYGCGPGLYTSILSKFGHKVIGVDVSETSLQYAKSISNDVKYINMNYIEQSVDIQIDAAMMIYCDFGALSTHNRIKYLKQLRKSLKQGGLFFFDVFSYNRFENLKEDKDEFEEEDGFFMPGISRITSETIKFPNEKVSLSYDKAVGEKIIELYNWDQHYNQEAICDYMSDNGFEVIDIYSNTYGNKDFLNNDIFFIVCKKI